MRSKWIKYMWSINISMVSHHRIFKNFRTRLPDVSYWRICCKFRLCIANGCCDGGLDASISESLALCLPSLPSHSLATPFSQWTSRPSTSSSQLCSAQQVNQNFLVVTRHGVAHLSSKYATGPSKFQKCIQHPWALTQAIWNNKAPSGKAATLSEGLW